jgi:acetylornithine/succinyldiaminopimelate/putrescine aminotransferase
VDEIQTGIWSPERFTFREYGLRPSCVAVGKGFPGGEYPASRLIFSAALDVMPQFGALVTNGQEELASLAYLITMRWCEANGAVIRRVGDYYEERMRAMAAAHPCCAGTSGARHMTTLVFHGVDGAKAFAQTVANAGLDVSAQTYKADCPPCVLTKLPITFDEPMVDFVVSRFESALKALG